MKSFLNKLPKERTFEGEEIDYGFISLLLFSAISVVSGLIIALS